MSTNQEMQERIRVAKARLEAARLRVHAAQQDEHAASYMRQASKPIYDGQSEICTGKGTHVAALAAETRARADLIEAEAGI